MKHKFKFTLREMAQLFRLKVKYVSYLDANTHGLLLIREKRILINAHKPRTEHVFTFLHEVAHFILHYQKTHPKYCPWYFRKEWGHKFIDDVCRKVRRYLSFAFNSSPGKEWEADLWALCAFFLLAKQLGCKTDLRRFINDHPEKLNLFLLVTGVFAYTNTKKRLIGYSKRFLLVSKSI